MCQNVESDNFSIYYVIITVFFLAHWSGSAMNVYIGGCGNRHSRCNLCLHAMF